MLWKLFYHGGNRQDADKAHENEEKAQSKVQGVCGYMCVVSAQRRKTLETHVFSVKAFEVHRAISFQTTFCVFCKIEKFDETK